MSSRFPEEERVFLSLGSNVGDRAAHIYAAAARLSRLSRTLLMSSLYETEPLYDADQPRFLNACLLATGLPEPQDLLRTIGEIEADLGRRRDPNRPKGPRPVDIDILLYGRRLIGTRDPALQVPHPGLTERAFVLRPLLEIAPETADPRDDSKLSEALKAVADQGVYQYRNM